MPAPIKQVLLLLLGWLCLAPAQAEKIALIGGTLIDGTGAGPVRDSVVLIDGERIERISTVGRVAIPEEYRLISTEGMTVMPGLWDPHVHLLHNGHPDAGYWFETYADRFREITIPASARQLLMAGVTSVRDLAAPTGDIMAVRRRIENGEIPGPDIYAAGAALVPGGSPERPHLRGVQDAGEAVTRTRALIESGADFIKVLDARESAFTAFRAIVETAHAAGIPVTAHGRSDEEVRLGLRAGVDEFQHIGTDSPRFPADILDTIRRRLDAGPPLYWSPTLGLTLNADELAAAPEFLDDPRNFAGLPEAMELDVRGAIAGAEFSVPSREAMAAVTRKVQQLNELGVIFVSGSDMGTFGHPASEATWRELEAWVFELDMEPITAIKWATLDAAAYMGVADRVGSVTPGKQADIIAVRGSPLRHFSALRDPAVVIKRGRRYK